MENAKTIIGGSAFALLATVLTLAPWCFGAWEAWWFWTFLVALFISSALFGLQLLLDATFHENLNIAGQASRPGRRRRRRPQQPRENDPWRTATLCAYLVLLGYALFRLLHAPVFMDGQRSFLMLATPLLVGLQVVYGLDGRQRRLLLRLILLNLLVLGLYGIINHALCGSRLVLWRPGYPQYYRDSRATGSYFCPDHYAGIMEMALCLALGVICAPLSTNKSRIACALLTVVALTGILLSKSRGGGLTTAVILTSALIWGVRPCSRRLRWALRAVLPVSAVILVALAASINRGYFDRFGRWFDWERAKTEPLPEAIATIQNSVKRSSRWVMLSGAMRAWKESPLLGIGPGMHQNVWPHVAASPDGDRQQRIWPSRLNNSHYSYEVHNDWAQLLEEYGIIGILLFMVAFVAMSGTLLRGLHRTTREIRAHGARRRPFPAFGLAFGAWSALLAMAFHSLGDFNLQMPATTWLFAAVMGFGARQSSPQPGRKRSAAIGATE